MGHLLAVSGGAYAGLFVFYVILYFVGTVAVWGTYKKAGAYGQPAWSAFVPVYNFIILLRIAGRPANWAWFLLLALVGWIPLIGLIASIALLVVSIFILNDVSKSFGHGSGFTVGLVLLSVVFWYILWLGKSRYLGPQGPTGAGASAGGYGGGGYGPEPSYPPPPGYSPPQPGYPPTPPSYPPPAAPPSFPPPAAPPSYPPPAAPPSFPPPAAPPSYPPPAAPPSYPPPAPPSAPPPPGSMPPAE